MSGVGWVVGERDRGGEREEEREGERKWREDGEKAALQECFRKVEGVNMGAHELFTPKELSGGPRCSATVVDQRWKGQARATGVTSK